MLLVAFLVLVCVATRADSTLASDVRTLGNPTVDGKIRTLTADQIAVRIVGGEKTDIRKRISGHRWIPENPRRFYVIAGATYVYFPNWSSVQMELIDMTLPHLGFKFTDKRNDIGLFRLKRALRINAYVRYATLPIEVDQQLFHNSTVCVTIGWGRQAADSTVGSGTYLRHVQVPLIPPSECTVDDVDPDSQICAGYKEGGRDACQGDSGGPLLLGATQIGIVSYGEGCARPNKPGVYTRVDFYLDWLNETIVKNAADSNNGAETKLGSYALMNTVRTPTCEIIRALNIPLSGAEQYLAAFLP